MKFPEPRLCRIAHKRVATLSPRRPVPPVDASWNTEAQNRFKEGDKKGGKVVMGKWKSHGQ
jgi:hypothetical protein